MELESGDTVLCTVDRIVGTTVFVKIEGNGEGSIVLSEIAPGRIRNLRDYVVPNKKIVCKVLRISGERIELSLRRVTQKEQKEVKEQYKQEKSYEKILRGILGEEADKIIKEILKNGMLYEFLEEAKINPAKLQELVGERAGEKILEILTKQKQKKAIIKKEIFLTTSEPNGMKIIKDILEKIKNAEIKYISAGRYSLKTESSDIKSADNKMKEIITRIEKESKKEGVVFSVK